MSDGDAFRVSLEEMATSAMSEKAAASWEAGDILQTRPAGLVAQVRGWAGVPTGQYRSSGLYGAPAKTRPESSAADRPNL